MARTYTVWWDGEWPRFQRLVRADSAEKAVLEFIQNPSTYRHRPVRLKERVHVFVQKKGQDGADMFTLKTRYYLNHRGQVHGEELDVTLSNRRAPSTLHRTQKVACDSNPITDEGDSDG